MVKLKREIEELKEPKPHLQMLLGGLGVAIIAGTLRGEFIHFVRNNFQFICNVAGIIIITKGIGYYLKDSVHFKVLRTIKNLKIGVKTEDAFLSPKIAHRRKEEYGHRYIIKTPEGIGLKPFLNSQQEFEQALNAECNFYERNGKVHLEIYNHNLPKSVSLPKIINMEVVENENTIRGIESRRNMEGH